MNNFNPLNILAIDDNPANLEVLSINIEELGHNPITAKEGETAWNIIQKEKDNIDIIIIDRMMPIMDGLELTQKIQADPLLRNIPIIIQSGKTGDEDLNEALDVGALFYLKKPYTPQEIGGMITSIAHDISHDQHLNNLIKNDNNTGKETFEIKTLNDMYCVISKISKNTGKQNIIKRVLTELILNAIEHGNLNIGYKTKEQLLRERLWQEEVTKRLNAKENTDKKVLVKTIRTENLLEVHIKDQGDGFNWQDYKEIKAKNIININGRGIATAFKMLPTIEYIGNGNEVCCKFCI